jgi:hypothetical protein
MMEAARASETSVDNYFTRQYIPEDKYGLQHMYYKKKHVLTGACEWCPHQSPALTVLASVPPHVSYVGVQAK